MAALEAPSLQEVNQQAGEFPRKTLLVTVAIAFYSFPSPFAHPSVSQLHILQQSYTPQPYTPQSYTLQSYTPQITS